MAPPTSGRSGTKIQLSPGARLDDSTCVLQLQQFLDEWHFRIVESCMARNWDRRKALLLALDMLELNGAKFPAPDYKEALLAMEEDKMIQKLVDCIPTDLRENFDNMAEELQDALSASTTLRKAVDDGNEEAVLSAVEATEGARGVEAVLRNCVLLASERVVKIRRCHMSWRQTTDNRIDRLERATEEAENCHRQLIAVEAQLDAMGGNQKSNAKTVLMSMAAKNDKVLLSSTFSSWLAMHLKVKADSETRNKFQKQLDEAEKKLFYYKERQLANVKGVLGRKTMEEGDNLRAVVIRFWWKQVEDRKTHGDTAENIKAAKARLEEMKSCQIDAAKKVLVSMSAGSDEGLMTMAMQAWQMFSEDYKKDKEFEDAVKKAEEKLKAQMDAKKEHTKRVMERMQADSEAGLYAMCWSAWWQVIAEHKKSNELQAKLEEAGDRFQTLKERQVGNARGVQTRINEMVKFNMMMRAFMHWQYDAKTSSIDAMFSRKLESKRRQLAGVQNLFRTFAAQLESGLAGGDDSSRDTTARTMPPKPSKVRRGSHSEVRAGSGMSRGDGSVSLPDIHEGRRPVHA